MYAWDRLSKKGDGFESGSALLKILGFIEKIYATHASYS